MQLASVNPELVFLSDWDHFTSAQLRDISIAADIDPLSVLHCFICMDATANTVLRCGDSLLINGKGNVNCPGVPFLMTLVPAAELPLLEGQNLTDKGCLALENPLAQTSYPHNYNAVPFGVFEGCNASQPNPTVFNVNPSQGWVSLNFISSAALQEMIVSIDEHPMWVYEVDGQFIEPQLIDVSFLCDRRDIF